MSRLEIFLWIASLLLTVGATWAITRRWTLRSIRRELGVYLDGASSLFEGVDPEVRESLHVNYEGTKISELWHVELIVSNDGERAIRNYVEPLTLDLPEGTRVLDAAVTASSPHDLEAGGTAKHFSDRGPELIFKFPLLNSGDWFRVKILVGGDLEEDPEDWTLRIRAEDLDSEISVRHARPLEHEGYRERKNRGDQAMAVFMVGSVAAYLAAHGIFVLAGVDVPVEVDWSDLTSGFFSALKIITGLGVGFWGARRVAEVLREGPAPQAALEAKSERSAPETSEA